MSNIVLKTALGDRAAAVIPRESTTRATMIISVGVVLALTTVVDMVVSKGVIHPLKALTCYMSKPENEDIKGYAALVVNLFEDLYDEVSSGDLQKVKAAINAIMA
jgi:catabolite regulation protein CreA